MAGAPLCAPAVPHFDLCRVNPLAKASGGKLHVQRFLSVYNILGISGTGFLLLPDGGIADMPVSALKLGAY